MKQQPIIIGITGGSGSGKTYFLKKLLQLFDKQDITVFSMDNYYLPKDKQKKDRNGVENFYMPESLDHERFVRDLVILKYGNDISIRE